MSVMLQELKAGGIIVKSASPSDSIHMQESPLNGLLSFLLYRHGSEQPCDRDHSPVRASQKCHCNLKQRKFCYPLQSQADLQGKDK